MEKALHYRGEPLTIILEDVLEHPFFLWPRTLISYRLSSDVELAPGSMTLLEATEAGVVKVDFQLVPAGERESVPDYWLRFFTDLPSGGCRVYTLSASAEPPGDARAAGETGEGRIRVKRQQGERIFDNGCMQVGIPERWFAPGGAEAEEGPGYLYRLGRSGGWLGEVRPHGFRAPRVCAEVIEEGPLAVELHMTCRGEEGCYQVRLRLIQGMVFLELDERMSGFDEATDAWLETVWSGFHPTHRYAPNRPFHAREEEAGFGRYPFEEIGRRVTDTHMELKVQPEGGTELPFCLLPYEPWPAFQRQNMASFWDEQGMDSIGIFIRRPENWDDGAYSIWSSSRRLAVSYHWQDGRLTWKHPLRQGTRSIAVCCYDHRLDIGEVERLERLWREAASQGRSCPRGPASYTLWLQQWYDLLSLDKVKDWTLDYPENAGHPGPVFTAGKLANVEALEKMLAASELVNGLALYGPCQDAGFSPVPSRAIYGEWIDAYDRLRATFSPKQRRRITGMYLLMGYLHASEDYMPMRHMLAGHPNFLADVKGVPALMAVLFPEHPCASAWTELFERSLELNLRYHVRADRPEVEAVGGRWTENIGCYLWAFLKPVLRTAYLLRYHYDGGARLHRPELARLARWILNSLTSPWSPDGSGQAVSPTRRRRMLLPQGAHARRKLPPWSFRQLAHELIDYDRETSEAILSVTEPDDPDFEAVSFSAWDIMRGRYPDSRGKPPSLHSVKHTGYGLALRSGVGLPEEAFVMLQQLDRGHNYRWGVSGQGGCGVLYYYAAGRAYSHNGHEDVGDDRLADTDLCTSFGVFKQGAYRSIGPHALHRPLLALGTVQFGELTPEPHTGTTAGGAAVSPWPDYVSRSVMMVGTDYIVLSDFVFNESVYRRFSWFVHRDEPFPHIHRILGGVAKRTELVTEATRGIWLDGAGDFIVLVAPREALAPEPTDYGCRLSAPGWTDLVFRRQHPFRWEGEGAGFAGTAGWIRKEEERIRVALIRGSEIRCGELQLRWPEGGDSAVELTLEADGAWQAVCRTDGARELELRFPPSDPSIFCTRRLYMDGSPCPNERVRPIPEGLILRFPQQGVYRLAFG
ncbi:hypothetical protein ACFFNY_17300 [Paenibacillus hodogayensis]|uniref:Heparin-sulfate lyase N-terminal domain-containing protein n=1 Tax=Paenibacillus hodogayensis TaxID=279208 RepID=A0ABV5VZ26_9BACL